MKTLAEFADLVAQCHAYGSEEPCWDGVVLVFAPCCGRRTAADTVLDVREVPGTIVAGGGHRAPVDHDWLCDGCRQRLTLEGGWSVSQLLSACGADAALVRGRFAQEVLEQLESAEHAAGIPHSADECWAAINQSLPSGNPYRPGVGE